MPSIESSSLESNLSSCSDAEFGEIPAYGTSDAAQQFLSLNEAVIVRMRGLPYDCTAEKIIEFFKTGENQISGNLDSEKDILFVNKIDGKATGDAFVRFSHKGDDVKALAKHKEVIGTRYIELFRSTTAEVQQIQSSKIVLNKTMEPLKQAQVELVGAVTAIPTVPAPAHCLLNNGGGGGAIPTMPQLVPGFLPPQQLLVGGSRKDCIRLRGLPYESQVQHILDFLGEYAKHVLLQGVHMVLNAQGHPSGEAFIQLDGEMAAAAAAADRHNKYMQIGKKQRYIEVFQCSADDMNLVLTGPTALQTSLITAANALQARPIMNSGANLFYPNAAALAAANLLPAHFFAQQQNPLATIQQQQQHVLGALQNGALPATQAFPNVLAGAARLPIIPNFTSPLPAGMPSPGALVYWPYPSPPVSPSNYYAAAFVAQAAQQQPGVVLLRGLPLNVAVNEILALFQGYPEISAECVQIQRTPTGQATGEALVTFPNRFEAERAVLEKNRQILGARPVELFIYGI
uniref:RRM domain-containing protein n=1 Tax=Romanomermis culicivorax TaxID=13658 RepID=A0A915KAL6_ROMCU